MARSKFARVAIATAVVIALGATSASAQSGPCAPTGVAGFDPDAYCPYGYVKKDSATPTDPATVASCCQRDTSIVSFPECNAASSAGAAGLQARVKDDSSWKLQDNGNAFARPVGKYTGMCFNIRVAKADCSASDPVCCTARPPAFLQFKLPSATVPQDQCRLSYGSAVAIPKALKRISAWQRVGTPGAADDAKFFNVPIIWKKGSKTGTACLYTLDGEDPANCLMENICGVGASPTVPSASGSYDRGCEMRLIGRKGPASTSCCAPAFSVSSFDSAN
jgi:hypothetical protein